MRIYLADLIYDTIRTNYVVPLNIGYIAALLEQRFASKVEITLFKYPTLLEKAIKNEPPDLFGLSHYSWNSRLNGVFLQMAKRLNPNVVTVIGGPNIRTDQEGIADFLRKHPFLDFLIMNEGEEPFANLVERLLSGDTGRIPLNCATLIQNKLHFEAEEFSKKSKEINIPSPYLTGWMDPFINDPEMIPMLETNRGCPYACVFCAWGVAALTKLRLRLLEDIFAEIDYIATHGTKKHFWIVCDANFGILPRDVKIAEKIREVMDNRPNGPSLVQVWASKNTTDRNLEIANIIDPNGSGMIALQSADEEVLENTGRGNIKLSRLIDQIKDYRSRNLEVATDIMLGLPGETAKSHQQTLRTVFDLEFGEICAVNIRLLPGSEYENQEFREKFQVKTKFRPIFGCSGIYDGKQVFELEESVRGTKDMTEDELNGFKVFHWLIFFTWNLGMFKPVLKFAKSFDVNPGWVLEKLCQSKNSCLQNLFREIEQKAMDEWFDTEEEMDRFYESPENFNVMLNHFMKLNFLYMARAYMDPKIIRAMEEELQEIITRAIKTNDKGIHTLMDEVFSMNNLLACKNLLQEPFSVRHQVSGVAAAFLLSKPDLSNTPSVEIEVSRPKEFVDFCKHYLIRDDSLDFSEHNLCRFFEINGCFQKLKNLAHLVSDSSYFDKDSKNSNKETIGIGAI